MKWKIISKDIHIEIGRRLYTSLFPVSLQPAIQIALNKARTEHKYVSIQLRFGENDFDLARYPWELLHDGKRFLLPGGLVEITRYVAYNEGSTDLKFDLPITMLYVSSRPGDLGLSTENLEQNRVLNALHPNEKIKIDIIEHSTFENLVKHINRTDYQIFHFDGHGVFAKQCPYCKKLLLPSTTICPKCKNSLEEIRAQTYLAFEGVDGLADFISSKTLENILTGSEIRLAFISACQTSMMEQDTFYSLGAALIRAGIPSVIAMQFEIEDADAALFCEEFYFSIATNKNLSRSLRLARKLLYNRQSWFIPTFYLRVSSMKLQKHLD